MNFLRSLFLLLYFLCVMANHLIAKPFVVLPESKSIDLRNVAFIYLDSNNVLNESNFSDLISKIEFKPLDLDLINKNKSNYWFRIELENLNSNEEWCIGFGNTNEQIKLYEYKNKQLVFVGESGSDIPSTHKNFTSGKDNLLQVTLPKGSSITYYVLIKNHSVFGMHLFANTLSYFKLYSLPFYRADEQQRRVFNAIFYGAIAIMFLYNLLISLSLRTLDYYTYVAFGFFAFWFNYFSDGYAAETFLSSLPNHDRFYRILLLPVLLSTYLLFGRIYLKSKLYTPNLDKIYYVLWFLLGFTYVIGFVFGEWDLSRKAMIVITLLAMSFVLIIAIVCYRKGYKPAIYFIMANVLLIFFTIIYALNLVGMISNEFIVKTVDYQFQLSSALEIGIFSLGLANRIKVAEKEKVEAQNRAIVALLENEKIIKEQNILLESKVKERTEELQTTLEVIEYEKKKSDELLLNILPSVVAEELKESGISTPQFFVQSTVIFADFVNFTQFSEKNSPNVVISKLDELFLLFDEICLRHGLEKIKTIGDCYLAAGGLPLPNMTNPFDSVAAAKEMIQVVMERGWQIRIGVNSGPVVAGVVGKHKFAYDIWGDTVNTASRLEAASEPNKINISSNTFELIKDTYACTYRGKILTKNKGKIDMYFVD